MVEVRCGGDPEVRCRCGLACDVVALMQDRRTLRAPDQRRRLLGSVSADPDEGYSCGTGKNRARLYEYVLGSARASREGNPETDASFQSKLSSIFCAAGRDYSPAANEGPATKEQCLARVEHAMPKRPRQRLANCP
ncbi:MAG: hypothetical protein V1800_04515 [Candidatus Latescibacterota bacterium]